MTEKLKKKPRMTCKKYCSVWNDVDKDCEIYGEHHFTPRTCPHYNIDILEKMKMAEMYNKIIEENYVAKTKNVAKNVANENSQDLTEQWKKGELPSGRSETLVQALERCERLEKQYDRAKWWLNEIVKNHRFTPISTAEKALKDLEELEK